MMFKIVSLVLCFIFLSLNCGFASHKNGEPLTPEERLAAFRAKQKENKANKYVKKVNVPSKKQMQKNNKGRNKGRE